MLCMERDIRPSEAQVFAQKTLDKLKAYGERIGIAEDIVADHLAAQYPQRSVRELALETGIERGTMGRLLRARGAELLSKADSIQVNRQQGRGIFGITEEERLQNSAKGGNASTDLGTGIHGLSKEQRTKNSIKAGSKGGSIARARGTGIFGMTEEAKHDAKVKAGTQAVENKTGIHAMTHEEHSQAGRSGGARSAELGLGVHSLTREERQAIGREAGKKSAKMGVGAHGIDPLTGERWSVIAARKTVEQGIGIHAQTHDDKRAMGIVASETPSSQKIIYEGNYYDSRVEASTAVALESFVPDFVIERGSNYQVVIPDVLKKVDFVIDDTLIEYNPIMLSYRPGYPAAFETRDEFETYRANRDALKDRSERQAYVQQVTEGLRRRYYQRRRAAIDENPDYRGKELVVVVNPEQLYQEVILRFGENYPPTQRGFVRFFNATLQLINSNEE